MWAPLLGLILASAPVPPEPEPELEPEPNSESEPEPERGSIAGGYVQLAPLGFALPGPGRSSDIARLQRAVRSGFRWGFAAGLSFEPVRHLFINATGSFEQTIWIFRNVERGGYQLCFRGDCYGWDERGVGHFLRVGADLRLGWTSQWVVTWALLSAQIGVSRVRLDCNNSVEAHCDRRETDVGPGIGAGLGLAIRATPRMALGFEGSIDHNWIDSLDDPFRAVRTFDLALVVMLSF